MFRIVFYRKSGCTNPKYKHRHTCGIRVLKDGKFHEAIECDSDWRKVTRMMRNLGYHVRRN